MKLIIIMGAHAVGKMTVGQCLTQITDLKLFYNHMASDLFESLFPNDSEDKWYLTELVRREVLQRFAASGQYGLIFTFMTAFNRPSNLAFLHWVDALFRQHGADVHYVELVAAQSVRLQRNRTENRLLWKPTKRNLAQSEAEFLQLESENRFVSLPGEMDGVSYLRLDTTNMAAEEAALRIASYFHLQRNAVESEV